MSVALTQTASTKFRGSPLSDGRAGGVHGGDRLPWVKLDSAGRCADNFTPLASLDWQAHVYGDAVPEVRALCAERHLALHEFPWHPTMEHAGLHPDGLYLVRPDGYVGLAAPDQSSSTVADYLDARAIRLAP